MYEFVRIIEPIDAEILALIVVVHLFRVYSSIIPVSHKQWFENKTLNIENLYKLNILYRNIIITYLCYKSWSSFKEIKNPNAPRRWKTIA